MTEIKVEAKEDWRPGQTRKAVGLTYMGKIVAEWKVRITIGRTSFWSSQVYLSKTSAMRAAKKIRDELTQKVDDAHNV